MTKTKKQEFIERVTSNPLIVNGLARITDPEQRKVAEDEMFAAIDKMGDLFDALSTVLEDTNVLEGIVEELKQREGVVNGRDGSDE